MKTYLILRRNAWSSERARLSAVTRSDDVATEMAADVRWIRTYVLAEEGGSLGSLCVYQATSEDKVREHSACACLPADEVILVESVVAIDPSQTDLRGARA
jgi:hypothetical protein